MLSAEAVRAIVQRNGRIVLDSVISTVRTTGMIFLILMAAFTLSYAFARLGISQDIADVIVGWNLTDWQLVLALVIFYLVLGTFMESFAMMVTTIPILLPTMEQAGVDLIWFGVIIVLLVEAALISPARGHQPVRLAWGASGRGPGRSGTDQHSDAAKHNFGRLDRRLALHGLHRRHDGPGPGVPGNCPLVAGRSLQ